MAAGKAEQIASVPWKGLRYRDAPSAPGCPPLCLTILPRRFCSLLHMLITLVRSTSSVSIRRAIQSSKPGNDK